MLKVSGDDEPLGKRWVQNFLKRNPQVATLLSKPIESSRIRGTQPEQINMFYEGFNEKSGNMPSYSLVWANMPSGVNMPSNEPHIS